MIELFVLLVNRIEISLAVDIASKLISRYAYQLADLLAILIVKSASV